MNQQLVELQSFKKNKRNVFVDFTRGLVEWKRQTYKLKYVKVGDKKYPYVIVEQVKPLSEIKQEIDTINERKDNLKGVEYEVNGHQYFVIGIGPIAIKAYKDEEDEAEFFHYFTTEGQYLLRKLVSTLEGCVLSCE